MVYDPSLAARIRQAVSRRAGVTERAMFGGLAFLLDGKMFCGVVREDLMVRVGPRRYEALLAEPDVRPMDFTGRPMNGYVYVGPAATRTAKAVGKWVRRGASFVESIGREPRGDGVRPRARR